MIIMMISMKAIVDKIEFLTFKLKEHSKTEKEVEILEHYNLEETEELHSVNEGT